jgi:hypothetical protein
VKINAAGYEDKSYAEQVMTKGLEMAKKAREYEKEILEIVDRKIEKS